MTPDRHEDSFTEFATSRWATLFRFAYLLTGNAPDAEDCVQVALVKAYAKWSKIERLDHPEAYVRKIVLNHAIDASRRRNRSVQVEPIHELPPQTSHDETTVNRLTVWDAVRRLPARQRAVIVLKFYADASEEQAAAMLGCSRGTVKSQTHDALRNLERMLGRNGLTEGLLQ